MKKFIILLIAVAVLLSIVSTCGGWPLYKKPAFRGRIIDAETKQPIEGAVVVVVYYRELLIGTPAGGITSYEAVKEILTDAKGEFYFPPYTGFIPFWKEDFTNFIIYKPGYMAGNVPDGVDNAWLNEQFYSPDVIGTVAEIRVNYKDFWKGPLGILELKKAKTKEERLRAMPSGPHGYSSFHLPQFFKLINEESRYFGLGGERR